MIGIKLIGILKCLEGTSRGGLVNHSPKYRGAYDYKTGRYIIPVDEENGAVLPEVTVTPKNNLDLTGSRRSDWIRDIALEALELTPIGDVKAAYLAAKDATEGRYLQAGIGAGLLLLPNILEGPLKRLVRAKVISNAIGKGSISNKSLSAILGVNNTRLGRVQGKSSREEMKGALLSLSQSRNNYLVALDKLKASERMLLGEALKFGKSSLQDLTKDAAIQTVLTINDMY